MKKLLFLIIIAPAIASLGHDLFMFYKAPDKGIRLSAVGSLWDKYHKESHDQWKDNVREFSTQIQDTIPLDMLDSVTGTNETLDPKSLPTETVEFAESFTQSDAQDKKTEVTALKEEPALDKNITLLQNIIGTVLEQKALVVFGGLALFIYLINGLLSGMRKEEDSMDKVRDWKKKKNKKGGYQYTRK